MNKNTGRKKVGISNKNPLWQKILPTALDIIITVNYGADTNTTKIIN